MRVHADEGDVLTLQAPEQVWLRRVDPQVSPAEEAAVAEGVTEQPSGMNDGRLRAIPASGPFDRFLRPAARRPSPRSSHALNQRLNSNLPKVPPRQEELDPLPGRSETPRSASTGGWRDRSELDADGNRVAAPSATESEVGNSFEVNESGNWVAREAINRVQPLHDPRSQRSRSESVSSTPEPTRQRTDTLSRGGSERLPDDRPRLVDPSSNPGGREQTPSAELSRTGPDNESAGASEWADDVLDSLIERRPGSSGPDARVAKREQRREAKGDAGVASASVGDLDPSIAERVSEPLPLDYTGRPAKDLELSQSVARMRRGIEHTLQYFFDRPEEASGRSNWGMMHALMVFGIDTKVNVGRRQYSAIAWIAGNNNCRGQRLMTQDSDGLKAKSGVGLQGHQGQFLAVLGMCDVPETYPLHAGSMKYSVADLIEAEKLSCRESEELTFTLIGLSHYLDTDSTWTSADGEQWDFERLIAEELEQSIVGAACGGTHRLMGYAHALRKRRAEGKPITGHWKRAEVYSQDFIEYAYSLQNRDGSMSTRWFEGRADNGDVDRKIQTTGHIVEWLLTVIPDDQLQDPRLIRAVNFLIRAIYSDLGHEWSIGPKGHALRSLAMFHQRVYRAGKPWETARLASGAVRTR